MNEDDTKTVVFCDMRCPLTGEIMVDPVVASDGRTYERDAIQSVIDDLLMERNKQAWLEQVPKLSSNIFTRICSHYRRLRYFLFQL